jgi:hypothetical protein
MELIGVRKRYTRSYAYKARCGIGDSTLGVSCVLNSWGAELNTEETAENEDAVADVVSTDQRRCSVVSEILIVMVAWLSPTKAAGKPFCKNGEMISGSYTLSVDVAVRVPPPDELDTEKPG